MNFKSLIVIVLSVVFGELLFAQDFDAIKTNADQAYVSNNYPKALELYQQILNGAEADSADMALIYSNAGMCCTQLNQSNEAIAYFKKAVSYKVPQLMIYDKLIEMTKAAKDYKNYEFALLHKLEEFPDFIGDVNSKLAYHYYNTQQYDKVLEVTNTLIEWYPDNAKYWLFNAVARQNLNDLPGAEKAYDKVLVLDPEQAGANMGKGMILYNRATAMYDKMKNAYDALDKPDRVDYSNYRKEIEKPKAIFAKALPYLLKAYENKAYASLSGIIKTTYLRLEDKQNADKY
ncbi:MAG: tetratricopeptide repeat protein [Prolixibacteraceae bacterium]